jgi:flagellar hook-basal body complex protein FliE
MGNEIQPIDWRFRSIEPVEGLDPQASLAQADGNTQEGPGFINMLREQIDEVIDIQQQAEVIQQQFTVGQIDDINQVILAVQKADLALNFALALRNKVIEAYQEISRMQI